MKQLTLFLALLIAPAIGHGAATVDWLVGKWVSSRGAIYESDGSNFVCVRIPENHMAEYGHWLNKNRLTEFQNTEDGLFAMQYLRSKNGETSQVPTLIERGTGTLTLRFKLPSMRKPMAITLKKAMASGA